MNHRCQSAIAFFGIAVICILLPFNICLGDTKVFTQKEGELYGTSYFEGHVLTRESNAVYFPDYIRTEKNAALTNRYSDRNTVKNIVLFLSFFFSTESFSSLSFSKRAFFVCYQSYAFRLARFLCDLFTIQEKDGKKKYAVLAS